MKNYLPLIILSFILSIAAAVQADTVYKKEGNKLKATSTSEVVVVRIEMLEELKTKKVRVEKAILKNTNDSDALDIKLRAELLEIEAEIAEAIRLGVTENVERP